MLLLNIRFPNLPYFRTAINLKGTPYLINSLTFTNILMNLTNYHFSKLRIPAFCFLFIMFGCLISTAAFHLGSKVGEISKKGVDIAATITRDEHKWSVYFLVIVIYLVPISISVVMYSLLYYHFKIFKNNQVGIDHSDEPNDRNSEGKNLS
jgi:hypothetical protein